MAAEDRHRQSLFARLHTASAARLETTSRTIACCGFGLEAALSVLPDAARSSQLRFEIP